MANLQVKDGAEATKYLKGSGAGTDIDPFIGEHAVTGPLTDTQLRASAVPVSAASLPLPSGAATLAEQQSQTAGIGALADAAVVTDANGSLSAKLRGLVKWAFERMPASLGQKPKTGSLAVVLASDQDTLPVSLATLPALVAGSAAIGKLAANSGVDIGDVDVASIAAGENHIGQVGSNSEVVDVTLSLDTSAYVSGDVLAETQEVASALRVAAGKAVLHSLILNDKDDQGAALDVVILRTNVSLGTENAAPSISDTNADEILGIISIISTDWIDLGGCKVATKTNLGLIVEAGAASTSLYIAAITRGTPTHSASGIVVKLGLLRD